MPVLPLLLVPLFAALVAGDNLYDQVYYTDAAPGYCVRLLHSEGFVGCTASGAPEGTIRYIPDAAALSAFLAQPPAYSVAALIEPSLFNRTNIDAIAGAVSLAGVAVLWSPSTPAVLFPSGFSAADSSPQRCMRYGDGGCGACSCAGGPTGSSAGGVGAFEWNPGGQRLLQASYNFAVVQLSKEDSADALARGAFNEARVRDGGYVPHKLEFKYEMQGRGNSVDCLSRNGCIPVGGYSVWTSPFDAVLNDSKPYVLMSAAMDSTALLHQLAAAGDSAVSSTAALLGAVFALRPFSAAMQSLPRRAIFALFDAESFGFVGSRMFLDDVARFRCAEYADDGGCHRPIKPDLTFLNLRAAPLAGYVELNQVALGSGLFAHLTKPSTAPSDALLMQVRQAAASMTPAFTVNSADAATPGLPPSSASSILRAAPTTPAVVLTDHAAAYANQFYHTEFDQVPSDGSWTQKITAVATLAARSMYVAAGGADASILGNITADAVQVAALLTCLGTNLACDLVKQFVSDADPSVTKYPGVYILQESRDNIGSLNKFLLQYLSQRSLFPNASTHLHDAVDPALAFDYDARQWVVTNASVSPLWTESNWPNGIGTRAFRAENPAVSDAMLAVGILFTAASVGVVHLVHNYCSRRFKTS